MTMNEWANETANYTAADHRECLDEMTNDLASGEVADVETFATLMSWHRERLTLRAI